MVARVTLAEIDTVRMNVEQAVERFRAVVLPALHEQDGYEGLYVLATPEGKALVMSLWVSEAAADAALASGFYQEQVEQFATLFLAPPGREQYEVALAEPPRPLVEERR
jgi:heme-degrading monooxygenase HmoA